MNTLYAQIRASKQLLTIFDSIKKKPCLCTEVLKLFFSFPEVISPGIHQHDQIMAAFEAVFFIPEDFPNKTLRPVSFHSISVPSDQSTCNPVIG